MFTLRLLGTASIDASHGAVTGRAAQGRRQVLLVLLGVGRPRVITSDSRIVILRPEATPDRARSKHSHALYLLRQWLGEDVVRSVGDGLVLNSVAVANDVEQFERRLEE